MKFLVLSFFPAFVPASSGGELRLGNLYRSLSRKHDITLLTSTDFDVRFEEIHHTPRFRELRFPKDELWRSAYATLEAAGVSGELSGLAFALAVSDPDCALRRAARELAKDCDAVIHEFPYSEPIFSDGSAGHEIYNAHNFEAGLIAAIVNGPGFERALLKVIRLEGNLVRRASQVFAPSEIDLERFRIFYGVEPSKLARCPNGFDDRELATPRRTHHTDDRQSLERPRLLFTGSAHYPNVDAVHFVLELAPLLPHCDFYIAGGVARALGASLPVPNVTIIGSYSAATKAQLFATADVFLNPVLRGSGTSLKAIEALGAGLPMVSTPEGVRGVDIVPGVHAIVVERQDFASAIQKLLGDPTRRRTLAEAGADLALQTYTWERIADNLSECIDRAAQPIRAEEHRPLILALNDYPVLVRNNGGVERIRGLLGNLDADIVLASFGPTTEFALLEPGLLHITTPKSAAHQAFEIEVNRGQPLSVNDGVASLFVGSNRILTTLLPELANRASAVVFEHCYMAPLSDTLRAIRADLPIIYSAHNVEGTLKSELLREHPLGASFSALIREIEEKLITKASLVVCTTEVDASFFAARGVETIVVANGCQSPAVTRPADAQRPQRAARGRKRSKSIRIGFMGSAHTPNIDAAEFILRDLAPAFPDITFDLVGGVCEAIGREVPPNVRLHGPVATGLKSEILIKWSVALNPVEWGGGASLKLPDYMAHGLATLNTPIGARGVPVEEWDVGVVASRVDFHNRLAEMLGDPKSLERQSANARDCATTRLGWRTVTEAYRSRLHELAVRPVPRPSASLLVVTYRYTEPPLGGAEEYLVQIIERLRPRFARIDLAAVDTGHLTNLHHFGAAVEDAGRGATGRIAEHFDRVVFFRPDLLPSAKVMELSRRLEQVWMSEERTLYEPFLDQLDGTERPRLVSGFFGPESHSNLVRRWTSGDFCFAIPANSCVFGLSGWTPIQKSLRLNLALVEFDGAKSILGQFIQPIEGSFNMMFAVPPTGGKKSLLLECSVDEHHEEGDHRSFGILLSNAYVMIGDRSDEIVTTSFQPLAERAVNLSEENIECSTKNLSLWVRLLNESARRRADSVEADFAAVRGPHSAALQEWIAEHSQGYDTVLLQGIPFDVVPSSVATLRRLPRPPQIVILPHFHGDDRFYYWRRYLESFEEADTTLLFSDTIADLIGPAEKFTAVPGGGIRSEELGDHAAIARFREVHATRAPFFLVLGRKTPSKGYRDVLRAHAVLRRNGINTDLVLIGPDEDREPVRGEGVYYLGLQPREVIRGALSECIGLVNMSRSESFGIVICEAWLFRKPVIANRGCYAFRDLVQHETTGLLVGDEGELGDAMVRLMDDPGLCQRLGEAGFIETMSRYTWPRVAESIYRALRGDGAASAPKPRREQADRRRRSARAAAAAAPPTTEGQPRSPTRRRAKTATVSSGSE